MNALLSLQPSQTADFDFTASLLTWFDVHGRHDLPWQCPDDPYKVWVSEIMLQQTQVKTVLQYFPRFIARFPCVADLAQAQWDDVAPYWAGLGYYARARNLHKAAQIVHAQGYFPHDLVSWMALPGIGRSTAGAMLSLGQGQYGVILDGNVKRVLARCFALQDDFSKPEPFKRLWDLASQLSPVVRNADYTQAIMDFGATLCTPKKPLCHFCPMQEHCLGYQLGIATDLPLKKIKKAVPIKSSSIILLTLAVNPSEADPHLSSSTSTSMTTPPTDLLWLWQQRPHQGLWGGLLSLPILTEQPELLQQLAPFELEPQACMVHIKHSFTHFTWLLNVQMFHVEPQHQQAIARLLNGQWLSVTQAQQKGLPTAMKKLIAQL